MGFGPAVGILGGIDVNLILNFELPMKPLVSVCMTTYNHAPYVEQAILSVLAQRTTFGVELIIGDDCSSDATAEICRRYEALYPERVRLITSEENVGMRANYRRVVEAARGEWVAMCDGDDFWPDEEKLQHQVEVLDKDKSVGLCYSRSKRFYEGKGEEWSYPRGAMYCDFTQLLFDNTVDNVTAVARRDLVMQYYREVKPELHPEWLTDDQPMWLWVAAKSKVVALERVTAAHRLLAESQSQSQDYRKRIAFCDSLMDISIWMDRAVGDGSHVAALRRKRMEVALWVLGQYGTFGEYVRRWWRDVCDAPLLAFDLAGYWLWLRFRIKRIQS